jgi:hypothetical protein
MKRFFMRIRRYFDLVDDVWSTVPCSWDRYMYSDF